VLNVVSKVKLGTIDVIYQLWYPLSRCFYLISLLKILLFLYGRSYRIVNPWLRESENELVLSAGFGLICEGGLICGGGLICQFMQ